MFASLQKPNFIFTSKLLFYYPLFFDLLHRYITKHYSKLKIIIQLEQDVYVLSDFVLRTFHFRELVAASLCVLAFYVCYSYNVMFTRGDAIKGHVTISGDKISKAVSLVQ